MPETAAYATVLLGVFWDLLFFARTMWIFRNNCYEPLSGSKGSAAKMLGKFQSLALVIGTQGLTVPFRGRIG